MNENSTGGKVIDGTSMSLGMLNKNVIVLEVNENSRKESTKIYLGWCCLNKSFRGNIEIIKTWWECYRVVEKTKETPHIGNRNSFECSRVLERPLLQSFVRCECSFEARNTTYGNRSRDSSDGRFAGTVVCRRNTISYSLWLLYRVDNFVRISPKSIQTSKNMEQAVIISP